MFKRVKRLWELSKKDHKFVDKFTDDVILNLPEEGDGKGEYLGEGTAQEFEDQTKKDKGLFGLFGSKK